MNLEIERKAYQILEDSLGYDGEARADFVADMCLGNETLQSRVEELLDASGESADFIDGPLLGRSDVAFTSLNEGDLVDRYRIEKVLGVGGMGTVYLASPEDPELTMKVALKVIHPDRCDEEALRRFKDELKILIKLDHPNVARPLDRGTLPDGRPYIVMEYVRGEPIDDYCNSRDLSISERLELFRKVCSAVQYAHQNLVVHRDLKPGNILVNEQGEPKLLDFGISRLLEPSPYSTSSETLRRKTSASFLGTLRYASPEQVRNSAGLTTTSDVYSLGVVLYELLTGHYPFQQWSDSFIDLSNAICQEEPDKPSTAVRRGTESMSADTLGKEPDAELTRGRFEVDFLRKRLSGDLDSIVLKALNKEPKKRYASVEELSEDLVRHRVGLPVEARDATFFYYAGRLCRRHWPWAVTGGLFVLAIFGFGLLMTWYWEAEREKKEIFEVNLSSFHHFSEAFALAAANSDEVQASDVLDAGIKRLDDMRQAQIENIERGGILSDQLPEDLPGLLDIFGWAYFGLGHYEEAKRHLEEGLDLRREFESQPTPQTVIHLLHLSATLAALEEPESAGAMRSEALALVASGDLDSKLLAQVLGELALLVKEAGDYVSAVEIYDASIAMKERVFGPSASFALGIGNRGTALLKLGRVEEAERDFRRSLDMRIEFYGEASDEVANMQSSLGSLLRDQSYEDDASREAGWSEAERLFRARVAYFEQRDPPRPAEVATGQLHLAALLQSRGKLEEAKERYFEVLQAYLQEPEPSLRRLGVTRLKIAEVLLSTDDAVSAETYARDAIADLELADPGRVVEAKSVLGACLLGLGRRDEAEPLLRDSLEALEAKRPDSEATRKARERVQRLDAAVN